jgi:hypothetical protein
LAKEIDALTKTYDLLLWVIPQLEKFPRSQKFLLGDRIEVLMLDILDGLIEAAYTRSKESLLRQANLRLEKLRYLFRLSHDLKYLSTRKYEFVSKAMNEIGVSIGGWLKYQKKRQ